MYHVLIVNEETNEVTTDCRCSCIAGVINHADRGPFADEAIFASSETSSVQLAHTLLCIRALDKAITRKVPAAAAIAETFKDIVSFEDNELEV